MNERINHQIIEKNGVPLFVLVPYDEYISSHQDEKVYFPHKVVELHAIEDRSIIRAWREYKKLSQREVAKRLRISQSAYSQMEKPDARLRKSTLEKIARALQIDMNQLQV
jgi:ribosome-binding protein aMBF1 (putative translation factor)